MKQKNKILAVSGCTLFVLISSAFAFLHQQSEFKTGVSATDTFSATIVERTFDELPDTDGNGIKDEMENLTSGKSVTLDPVIVSTAQDDMWAIIKVSVPTVTSTLSTDDGKAVHDVFTFTPNTDYKLLSSTESDVAGTPSIYYYGLNSVLPKNSESVALFTEITVNDFASNEELTDASVDVTGAIVQARSVESVDDAFKEVGEF